MYIYSRLFFSFLLLCSVPFAVGASEAQTITVGAETVSYTQTFNDIPNATSYYNNDTLVLTIYDENTDGKPDLWVLYREDMRVEQEMRDSDADGKPDIYYDFDQNENVLRVGGEGYDKYTEALKAAREPKTIDAPNSEQIDYAGNLDDIQKLAGESSNWWLWLLLLGALTLGGFTWWKRQQ